MKHAEWLDVGARVAELWPGQPWPPETMASAYDLFAQVPQAPVLAAVVALSAGGREFAPAPGVVLSRALAIVINSTPALTDPDLTRALTAEEQVRARRLAAVLTGDKGKLVVATWLEFAAHANVCRQPTRSCGLVATRCRRSGRQSGMFPPMLPDLCADGRQLFEAWRFAVDELRMTPEGVVQQEAAL